MAWKVEIGDVHGRLTVLSLPRLVGKYRYMRVRCACGVEKDIEVARVCRGDTRSCGCLKLEKSIARIRLARKPKSWPAGSEKSLAIWKQMISRCNDPGHKCFRRYGGRGITVSLPWHDFLTFYADMGTAPDGYVLDRTRNNEGYSKENCTWVTRADSTKNRELTIWVNYLGKEITLTELSALIGIPYDPLLRRHVSMRPNIDMNKLTRPLAERTKRNG